MRKTLLLTALTVNGLLAAPLTGKWSAKLNGADVVLILKQDGEELSGKFQLGDAAAAPIERAKIDGDIVTSDAQDSSRRPLRLDLTLVDGKLGGVAIQGNSKYGVYFSIAGFIKPKPPALIKKVDPTYTKEARAAKSEGMVTLQVVIDSSGAVTDNIKVLQGLGMGLDEKAVMAALKWKFKPATRNGEPVSTFATIEVNFRLAAK